MILIKLKEDGFNLGAILFFTCIHVIDRISQHLVGFYAFISHIEIVLTYLKTAYMLKSARYPCNEIMTENVGRNLI